MSLLEVQDLSMTVAFDGRRLPILRGVSFAVEPGEAVGLVGESGSGKSMTARSVMRLTPASAVFDGAIRFDGEDVLAMSQRQLRSYRAQSVSMVFQDSFAHINPVRRIGDYLTEASRLTLGVPKAECAAKARELLAAVGIREPAETMERHPHELSGGMLQRVMIASALMTDPKLLLADEPTTALDVTTQAEIMAIIGELRAERGIAVVFITHDLELAAATCDRTLVMYAGTLVEEQPSRSFHDTPLHPYSEALLRARPEVTERRRLLAVPGRPVAAYEAPAGCPFQTRCAYVQDRCAARPPLEPIGPGRSACWRADELAGGRLTLERPAGGLA